MEFPGILRHAAGVSPAYLALDWSRSARLGDHELVLAANGAGAQRAALAVEAALERFPAEAIVSTGFCGALAEELNYFLTCILSNTPPAVITPEESMAAVEACLAAEESAATNQVVYLDGKH